MNASGQNATEAEVQQIIKEVDRDGDGTIDFEGKFIRSCVVAFCVAVLEVRYPHVSLLIDDLEFVAMMTGRPMAPPSQPAAVAEIDAEAEYKTAWKEFDPSLQGSISAAQFRQVMAGMGETVTDAEVDEIIDSVDGENKISCEFSWLSGRCCEINGQKIRSFCNLRRVDRLMTLSRGMNNEKSSLQFIESHPLCTKFNC